MGRGTDIIGRARRATAAALVAGAAWLAPALPAIAQGAPPATLIADDIRFDQGSAAITARGGVEVFFEGARLRAHVDHLFPARRPDHRRGTADPDRPLRRRGDRGRVRRPVHRPAERRAAIRAPCPRPAIADRGHADRPRRRALHPGLPGCRVVLRGVFRPAHAAVGNPRPPCHPRRGRTAALFRRRAVPRDGPAGDLAAADAPARPDAGARHRIPRAVGARHGHHRHADPRALFHHAGRSRGPDADALDRPRRQPDDRIALPAGLPQRRGRGHGFGHLGRSDRRRRPRSHLRRRGVRHRPGDRPELPDPGGHRRRLPDDLQLSRSRPSGKQHPRRPDRAGPVLRRRHQQLRVAARRRRQPDPADPRDRGAAGAAVRTGRDRRRGGAAA
jgi:hypothetical protein